MTIFISGGSNSIMKFGWTSGLETALPGEKFINLSIGATASITGNYRVMFNEEVLSGDTVVWEWALNDLNHISNKNGLSEEFLLSHVEMLLAHCACENINLVALILTPRSWEIKGGEISYHEKLEELFMDWNVKFCNVSKEYREILNVPAIPANCYEAPQHFVSGGVVVSHIRKRAIELLVEKTVPTPKARKYSNPKNGIEAISNFNYVKPQEIGTRLVMLPAFRPEPTLETVMPANGILTGAIFWAGPKSGGFEIKIGKKTHRLSATIRDKSNQVKNRFSAMFFEKNSRRSFSFRKGANVLISLIDAPCITNDRGNNKRRLTSDDLSGEAPLLVCLLIEIPGGKGASATFKI